ncbi:hypothetical protein [Vineibacter terrae]|nr:hypothetical protein [Vineibacter terrae]
MFTGNWFIWLLPLGCLVMHLFHGHGGHGGGSRDHDHGGPHHKDGRGDVA